jgi:hypothetical protein
MFTGATVQQILPGIPAQLARERGDPNNRDISITNIVADKQGSVDAADLPSPSALHINVGVQHEIAHDFVISADFYCSDVEPTDSTALCSLGPISLASGIGCGLTNASPRLFQRCKGQFRCRIR